MKTEERIIMMLDIQDRANMVAINFAGKTISSGDGTYDLLRYDVANAIREIVTEAIEEDRKTRECCKTEREACAGIIKKEIERWDRESVVELRESILHEIKIRARSESEKKEKSQ